MPMIRINARAGTLRLHSSPRPLWPTLTRACRTSGPVIVMIHGFRYQPGHKVHCPHRHILSLTPEALPWRSPSWPRQLGFGVGNAEEGLAIAFGWQARGALWQAQTRARQAGHSLAQLISHIDTVSPGRPVHILTHSMGVEPALEALLHLRPGIVRRIVSITGACYRSRVEAVLDTPAGTEAEFINVTSRENDLYDFLFERAITPPRSGDRAIGLGLRAPNAVTLQLDCDRSLAHVARLGTSIAAPRHRVCHWSGYMRPGALRFYANLLRRPDDLSLSRLRQGLPLSPAPRWSRLVALPRPQAPLPFLQKA